MNGLANPCIRPAAAYVSGHRLVDVLVRWLGLLAQQHSRTHQLSGLAVAALRHILFDPCLLQRMTEIRRKSFNGGDLLPRNARYRRDTRADRLAIQVDGARAALG